MVGAIVIILNLALPVPYSVVPSGGAVDLFMDVLVGVMLDVLTGVGIGVLADANANSFATVMTDLDFGR